MKCPKCGFISFPGPRECKRCGASLPISTAGVASRAVPGVRAGFNGEGGPQFASSAAGAPEPLKVAAAAAASTHLNSAGWKSSVVISSAAGPPDGPEPNTPEKSEPGWAKEIPERVANYRRRREGSHEPLEMPLTLPFSSDSAHGKQPGPLGTPLRGQPEPKELDIAFGDRGARDSRRSLDSLALASSHTAPLTRREPELSITPRVKTKVQPIEFLEPDFSETSPIPASDFAELPAAPVGKRFTAGVLDALSLLVAAGIFAAVFRAVGGQIQPGRLSMGVLLLIAGFWVFTYFAAFSAVTSSTPGQAFMGLSVRNFDGELPTRPECLLRAFGYLVSLGSMMLGFLWAVMDSDGLAWHDHISGTLLAEVGASGGCPEEAGR